MSSGMPSMTALLGMLALAGYQNRDKLTGSDRQCARRVRSTVLRGDQL
jgi:hypothetical protein